MRSILILIVNFWILFSDLCCLAQTDRGLRFEHITVNEGLSHSDAMAVIQDREGFVWVGTNNGVNRYDGYELKKYDLPNDHLRGLSSNRIRTLHLDKSGLIWVGSEGTGLFFYDEIKDVFVPAKELAALTSGRAFLDLLSSTSVLSITSDPQ